MNIASPVGCDSSNLRSSFLTVKTQGGQCPHYLVKAEINTQKTLYLVSCQSNRLRLCFARVNIN